MRWQDLKTKELGKAVVAMISKADSGSEGSEAGWCASDLNLL